MRIRRYLILGLVPVVAPFWIAIASPASAECVNTDGGTLCAQGDVRGSGGGNGPGFQGPMVPYPCEYDWYCDDWGLSVITEVNPPVRPPYPGGGPVRPGGPGGPNRPGGGIGPR